MSFKYIHQLKDWPDFSWDNKKISEKLVKVRHDQGRLISTILQSRNSMQVQLVFITRVTFVQWI